MAEIRGRIHASGSIDNLGNAVPWSDPVIAMLAYREVKAWDSEWLQPVKVWTAEMVPCGHRLDARTRKGAKDAALAHYQNGNCS